ncbi:MAG: family 16 glycoside hydrolase [Planctomycetota bacterium]
MNIHSRTVRFKPTRLLLLALCAIACTLPLPSALGQDAAKDAEAQTKVRTTWLPLTDWRPVQFGGEGEVTQKTANGELLIELDYGDPLTGVVIDWEDAKLSALPRNNYELELLTRRTDGFDFFCALTFPIDKACVSLVLGGWGGSVTGISSINYMDASENATTLYRQYENDKWYRVRVRVDDFGIRCFVDDEDVVDVMREADPSMQMFDVRPEVELCKPIGMANFQTTAEFKGIRIRRLKKDEIQSAKQRREEYLADE